MVVLGGDADQTAAVEVDLRSLAEGYYRQQIADNPRNLQNHADLAHHYVLEKKFAEAADVFADGVEVALTRGGRNDPRFWQEIQRVLGRQYAYGSGDDVQQARRLICDRLRRTLEKHPGGHPLLYVNYVLALDVLGQREKAREMMAEALGKFSGNKQLHQLRKQRGL